MIASLVTGEEEFSGKPESIEPATIVAVAERRSNYDSALNAHGAREFHIDLAPR